MRGLWEGFTKIFGESEQLKLDIVGSADIIMT